MADLPNLLSFTATTCIIFYARTLFANGNGSIDSSGCAVTFSNAAFLAATVAR